MTVWFNIKMKRYDCAYTSHDIKNIIKIILINKFNFSSCIRIDSTEKLQCNEIMRAILLLHQK